MIDKLTLEVVVDSVESVMAAQQGGAHRLELCANLLEGGTTPSAGSIAITRQHCDLPMHVMIRPRGGDFCYSDVEFEMMKVDITRAKELGADGLVFGILRPDASIDRERCAELLTLARPLSVTFHRAFDVARDPFHALEVLISLGFERLLTSGQEKSAFEGLGLITELVKRAGGRIIVMPGGGVTERNINQIVRQSGVTEAHVYSAVTEPSEHGQQVTDAGRVASFLDALEL
jgi:copper homeostasis protein